MNGTVYESILDNAMSLPADQRSRLAEQPMESVNGDEPLSPEWLEEIDRRMRSLSEDDKHGTPHDEVMANVRKLVEERRKLLA
jgi:putative addiction module component (TIGR02574 family)